MDREGTEGLTGPRRFPHPALNECQQHPHSGRGRNCAQVTVNALSGDFRNGNVSSNGNKFKYEAG